MPNAAFCFLPSAFAHPPVRVPRISIGCIRIQTPIANRMIAKTAHGKENLLADQRFVDVAPSSDQAIRQAEYSDVSNPMSSRSTSHVNNQSGAGLQQEQIQFGEPSPS